MVTNVDGQCEMVGYDELLTGNLRGNDRYLEEHRNRNRNRKNYRNLSYLYFLRIFLGCFHVKVVAGVKGMEG